MGESAEAYRLYSAEPLSRTMLKLSIEYPLEHTSVKFNRNITEIFIQANAFENVVCKMMAILFRPQ